MESCLSSESSSLQDLHRFRPLSWHWDYRKAVIVDTKSRQPRSSIRRLIECVAPALHAGLKGKVVVSQLLLGDCQLLSRLRRDLLLSLQLLICRLNLFLTATVPSWEQSNGGTDRGTPTLVSRNRAE